MIETNNANSFVEAMIYLKNGLRKYGVLLNTTLLHDIDFRFISSSDLGSYKATNDPRYIENIPESFIEAIDIALK